MLKNILSFIKLIYYKKIKNNNNEIYPFKINNYVYINKSSKIHVYQEINEVLTIFDITNEIRLYISPKYNFYKICEPLYIHEYLKLLSIHFNYYTEIKIYDNLKMRMFLKLMIY